MSTIALRAGPPKASLFPARYKGVSLQRKYVPSKELCEQLKKAHGRLNELLAVEPNSHHKLLLKLYKDVEAGLRNIEEYPTARHLFWDNPKTELEEQCLLDAARVFQLARGKKGAEPF